MNSSATSPLTATHNGEVVAIGIGNRPLTAEVLYSLGRNVSGDVHCGMRVDENGSGDCGLSIGDLRHVDILSVGMVEHPTVAVDGDEANPAIGRITCALCERRVDRGTIECTAVDCPHAERQAA